MHRDMDSSDTLTLTHELKPQNALTSVSPRTNTLKCQRSVREVSRVLSVKCQCVGLCVVGIKVSEKNIPIEEVS